MCVLLADESPTIKKVFQLALKDYAAEVHSVNTGLDVEPVTKKLAPDIVFADILLQKKNGYDVSSSLKSSQALKAIPVVLMCSEFMDIDEDKFQGCLANAKLEKPFEVDTLRRMVKSLVPKTRSQALSSYLTFPTLPETMDYEASTPPPLNSRTHLSQKGPRKRHKKELVRSMESEVSAQSFSHQLTFKSKSNEFEFNEPQSNEPQSNKFEFNESEFNEFDPKSFEGDIPDFEELRLEGGRHGLDHVEIAHSEGTHEEEDISDFIELPLDAGSPGMGTAVASIHGLDHVEIAHSEGTHEEEDSSDFIELPLDAGSPGPGMGTAVASIYGLDHVEIAPNEGTHEEEDSSDFIELSLDAGSPGPGPGPGMGGTAVASIYGEVGHGEAERSNFGESREGEEDSSGFREMSLGQASRATGSMSNHTSREASSIENPSLDQGKDLSRFKVDFDMDPDSQSEEDSYESLPLNYIIPSSKGPQLGKIQQEQESPYPQPHRQQGDHVAKVSSLAPTQVSQVSSLAPTQVSPLAPTQVSSLESEATIGGAEVQVMGRRAAVDHHQQKSKQKESKVEQLSEDKLEEIIRAQSQEMLEAVVRRVVPDLATQMIEKELQRLLEAHKGS